MRNEEIVILTDEPTGFDGQRVAVRGVQRRPEGALVLLEHAGPGQTHRIEVLLREERAIARAQHCLLTGVVCRLQRRPRIKLHFIAGPWDGDSWVLVDDDALDARRKGRMLCVTRERNGATHRYVFKAGNFPDTMFLWDAGYVT
jgi:hypothetical protein